MICQIIKCCFLVFCLVSRTSKTMVSKKFVCLCVSPTFCDEIYSFNGVHVDSTGGCVKSWGGWTNGNACRPTQFLIIGGCWHHLITLYLKFLLNLCALILAHFLILPAHTCAMQTNRHKQHANTHAGLTNLLSPANDFW